MKGLNQKVYMGIDLAKKGEDRTVRWFKNGGTVKGVIDNDPTFLIDECMSIPESEFNKVIKYIEDRRKTKT